MLESLPTGSGPAPNMRADVCLHRSRALIAAAEEEGAGGPAQGGAGVIGGPLPAPLAAFFASATQAQHTELPFGRIHFDPVPVFIGPIQGWKGPVLGARPATNEAGAKTLSVEKASADANARRGTGARPQPSSKSTLKSYRHAKRRIAVHKAAVMLARKRPGRSGHPENGSAAAAHASH